MENEVLQQVAIFSQLDADHRAQLTTHITRRTYRRGTPIFHQGSAGSELLIVASGQVRLYTLNEAGQELTVMFCRPGDFFGELALLDGRPRSATALAQTPVTLLVLGRAAFRNAIQRSPLIAVAVLEALASRLRSSTHTAEQLVGTSAPQRVTQQLAALAQQHGKPQPGGVRIDLRLTQDDLASLAGTTRETVNRVLATLRHQGIIHVERTQIHVLQPQVLAEQALGA